jgi:geranylgeranyl diphosphate synthase type I
MNMLLEEFNRRVLPAIETELQQVVQRIESPGMEPLHHMVAYHMGWDGEKAGPNTRGKRIRPLLVLLSAHAAGGSWEAALPAAAAVELVHNFSLIHDDIEDNSPLRRGRKTVWTIWGVPQAINVGDALYSLAHLAILRLEETTAVETALKAARILQETCLKLTKGQYLDMAFEKRDHVSLDEYWSMVDGKTAALLAACTELGALCAKASQPTCLNYQEFGHSLGLAFQAQDDLLGIWGDAALTGKSTESDLITAKKSLPTLFGISQNGPFARRWDQGPIQPEEVRLLARQLEIEGGLTFTQKKTEEMTRKALQSLAAAQPESEGGNSLIEFANQLVTRNG